jgi:hypothetical protein
MLRWIVAILYVGALVPAAGDQQTINDIEGLWKLVEWHEGEDVLVSPQIGGRLSLNEGTILYMVYRESADESMYIYGYGAYSITGNEYRYGYDRFTEVIVRGDEKEVWSGSRPESRYTAVRANSRLEILEADSRTSGLVLDGNRLTWTRDSKPLRVYERVQH